MKCPHCNQEHPDGFQFCPTTGRKLEVLKACTLNPACPDHGRHILPLDSLFCPTCGCRLEVNIENEGCFYIKGVKFKMIHVEGGRFYMGEYPNRHLVELNSYCIGETVVTQELWEVVMGNNPSFFRGGELPVESVSWEDCYEFISRINEETGRQFRLPNEAEWEFAARGGNKEKDMNYKYSGSNQINEVAWYNNNSDGHTHSVKEIGKMPNGLGIYGMSGNIWEMCEDGQKVARGGCWYHIAGSCSVYNSLSYYNKSEYLGFRLAYSQFSRE